MGSDSNANNWIAEHYNNYDIFFKYGDKENIKEYNLIIEKGIHTVEAFFGKPFKEKFDIYIHPNRKSIDSTWQIDWKLPNFKSECWMVASGVASKIDLISPIKWNKESCEHNFNDTLKTQQLITHELVHVFHGQLNKSPDFSSITGLDWFVEGLAVYVSGQCDSTRLGEIKNALSAGAIPMDLDKFWTGNLKYGLSGSVVMYIDYKFGRQELIDLLNLNKKDELLEKLNIKEPDFLNGWEQYIEK
jgi:hypothetical protein